MISDNFLDKLKPLYFELEKWVPNILLDTLLKTACQIRFYSFPDKQILKRNLQLKDKGYNKRAFLLATGPSINNEDLKLLKNEDCFSLSNFFLHPDLNIVNPKYHFVAAYHEPLVLDNFIEWLKRMDQELPADTKIVLSHPNIALVKQYNLFKEREVFYLYNDYLPFFFNRMNITKPILAPQTGPLLILPVLAYMGYKEIYLLGCDHTNMRDYKRTLTNFYAEDDDFRVNATSANMWDNTVWHLRANLRTFQQYSMYKKAFDSKSIKIVNLSTDSWLDLFSFDRLENIIQDNTQYKAGKKLS